jgi:putative ABC transport system ATP-binding protein
MSHRGIELAAIEKRYEDRAVLTGIDLRVEPAEVVAIVGRSGSGKSTLLRILAGLELPTAGRVSHDGVDIARLSETERSHFRRRRLGFVFQFFNLLPTLTARENVSLPLTLNGLSSSAAAARAQQLLAELHVDATAHRFPDQLSGGEQQRVAIARALVHEPGLVIADEPTGNLDAETAFQVLDVLTSSCRSRGTTLIMATHSDEVIDRADRVLRVANNGGVEPVAQ